LASANVNVCSEDNMAKAHDKGKIQGYSICNSKLYDNREMLGYGKEENESQGGGY